MSPRAREVILALDQGSSSSRAILFDLKGKIVALAQRPVRTRRPKAGWAATDLTVTAASGALASDEILQRGLANGRKREVSILISREQNRMAFSAIKSPSCRPPQRFHCA